MASGLEQRVTLDLGSAVNAISTSPSGNLLVAGGREVFKLLSITPYAMTEVRNLRRGRINLSYSITDVKWNPHEANRDLLASGASNGNVVIWNIARGGSRQHLCLADHRQTVNRVAWNPTEPGQLITGSHDGTVRLWDVSRGTCRTTFTCPGKESVRDVSFHPQFPSLFGVSQDSGLVQVWDSRTGTCTRQMNAHQGLALGIDWHPVDVNTLASGGRDRMIYVWELSNTARPQSSVQTINSVSRVKWRPRMRNHIASSATVVDKEIHVWNVQRPFLPVLSFMGIGDVVTGFLWHMGHPDRLISCSKDGTVTLQLASGAHHPHLDVCGTALSWGVGDDVASASDCVNRAWDDDTPQTNTTEATKAVRIAKAMKSNEAIRFLAQNYRFQDASIDDLCDHNAQVAAQANCHHIAKSWQILRLLLRPTAGPAAEVPMVPPSPISPPRVTAKAIAALAHPHESPPSPLSPVLLTPGHVNLEELMDPAMLDPDSLSFSAKATDVVVGGSGVSNTDAIVVTPIQPDISSLYLRPPPQPATISPSTTTPMSPAPSQQPELASRPVTPIPGAGSRAPLPLRSSLHDSQINELEWSWEAPVKSLLGYYAAKGDVQTCATIALVLGNKNPMDMGLVRQWFHSYVDLLHRMQMWNASTEILRGCTFLSVRALNKTSTTIHMNCGHCLKPLIKAGWMCEHCKQMFACAVCHLPVRGVFVWCQGCGHGGHLEHMRDWFRNNLKCPTGCKHTCQLTHAQQ